VNGISTGAPTGKSLPAAHQWRSEDTALARSGTPRRWCTPRTNDGDAERHWLASEGGDANYYLTKSHPGSHDTDGDGIADDWERAIGLTLGTRDHSGDLDNDGYQLAGHP
jgi:hypothetical protein